MTRTLFAASTLALSIALTAGVAAAQTPPAAPPSGAPGGGGMGMGMGMRGPMNLEAMTARQDMMFGRMDTNQDGFLTGDELAALSQGPMGQAGGARMRAQIARADANGDSRISREEMRAAAAVMFARMDANHDGVISEDERPQMGQGQGQGRMSIPMPSGDQGMPPMGDPAPGN